MKFFRLVINTLIIIQVFKCLSILPFQREVRKVNHFPMNKIDPLSYSNTHEVRQTKLFFDVEIDMDNEVIKGKMRFHYKCLKNINQIILDVKTLQIFDIKDSGGQELNFYFVRHKKVSRAVGRGLIIQLKEICLKNSKEYIEISYSTTQKSIAVHFSHPTILLDKNHKFMYTHGPAIFARTLFPCQDTPSAKVLVDSKIKIAKPYTVLFSGRLQKVKELNSLPIMNRRQKKNMYEYHFRHVNPLPTYLISFTAAVLEKREIGNLCEVYTEVPLINSPKIDATFQNCSEYVKFYSKNYIYNPWGKMIFIILPDDFPYAGMENPYGIQISYGMLTDDGSNKNVIAHEIAHFWSGNLVTTLTWEHFWLNEGLTNYLYRKCFQYIYGQEEFSAFINL
jgi:leukotriene-A4 hydrolase